MDSDLKQALLQLYIVVIGRKETFKEIEKRYVIEEDFDEEQVLENMKHKPFNDDFEKMMIDAYK